VMHATAIRKHGEPPAIAAIAGLPLAVVEPVLQSLVAAGRVNEAQGRYLLSPAGQLILAGNYSRFESDLRANASFMGAYERFELINRDLKQVITDWQTMDLGGQRVANDHGNKDYDAVVIDRLGDLHERFEPMLRGLVSGAPRLRYYADALGKAFDKAEDGAIEWVSDARIDSYHTVWFELHEDLLRLVGRQREE